jgi:IS4 transposase
MNYTESVRMAQRYAASEEAYQRLTQIMCTEVSIPVSKSENARYDEKDLHRSLMTLSINNAYAESGMDNLAIKAGSADVPSGSWVRDAVGRVPEEEMNRKLERALGSTLDQLKGFGVFTTPVIAGLDKHKLPRYDKDTDRGFLRRSKKDRGTTKFEFYASLQSVEEGRRAQIACEHFGFFDENDEVVERMVTEARLRDIDVSLLLMDREFFSARVINGLKKVRQTFLMPCRLTKGVKQAVMEHAQGKRETVSEHAIRGSGDDREVEASFTLVIFPKAGCEKEEDPLKRYIPFATNIPRGKILWNISRLPKDYRLRWGIESGYVGIEQFRARTTSRNHSLRLLYFFYAMILYNAWLLANLTLARSICKHLKDPIITVQVLKAVFERIVVEAFGKG